jgi:hypothetical protein
MRPCSLHVLPQVFVIRVVSLVPSMAAISFGIALACRTRGCIGAAHPHGGPGSASLLSGRLIISYLYGATRGTVPTPSFAPLVGRTGALYASCEGLPSLWRDRGAWLLGRWLPGPDLRLL